MIEHKRCPTGNISQQQNQSQNKPVQNANTSHAAEACRLRASRRAEYASVDASGALRRTCQLRAGKHPGQRRESRRVSAPERAECARRCAPSKRVGARGARAYAWRRHAWSHACVRSTTEELSWPKSSWSTWVACHCSLATQELLGQDIDLRALRTYETKDRGAFGTKSS